MDVQSYSYLKRRECCVFIQGRVKQGSFTPSSHGRVYGGVACRYTRSFFIAKRFLEGDTVLPGRCALFEVYEQ